MRLAAYPSTTSNICAQGASSAFTANLVAERIAPPSETDPYKLNPYLGKKRAKQSIPLMVETAYGKLLSGTLAVSITAKGRITARFAGAGARSYSFSGKWQDQDKTDGTMTAAFRDGDTALLLALAADGTLTATMTVPGHTLYLDSGDDTVVMCGAMAAPQGGTFTPYAGCYTVQMPAKTSTQHKTTAGGISLMLKMTSKAAVKNGKMSYSAMLPNGKTASGTAKLELKREIDKNGTETECAWLPIFKHTSKYVFAAMVRLSPNGAATWETPSNAEGLDVVGMADGSLACFLTRGNTSVESFHDAYGSWFKAGSTPTALCERFSLSGIFNAAVAGGGLESERYGDLTEAPIAVLKAGDKKFAVVAATGSLKISSYASKTGLVKGKGKLKFRDKTVNGGFAGIVMPGWIDCQCGEGFVERPFAAGSFWFTDYVKQSGKWVKTVRSVPFEIESER